MSISRREIVDCARSFVGTPFVDKGRGKGRGIDCVGLPLMIGGELGLVDTGGQPINGQTYKAYAAQPVTGVVRELCSKHLVRKALEERKPGDIVLMRFMGTPTCHVGIYAGEVDGVSYLIHAYATAGKCVEQPIDDRWWRFIVAIYSYPGIEE